MNCINAINSNSNALWGMISLLTLAIGALVVAGADVRQFVWHQKFRHT